MASIWNNRISISIFGESHGAGIGVVIDNLPPGEYIRMEEILAFMSRRAPKKSKTPHHETKKTYHRLCPVCTITEQQVLRFVL